MAVHDPDGAGSRSTRDAGCGTVWGVVVIPPEHVAEVAAAGFETERKEAFLRDKISVEGYPSTTAYPPNDDVLREYEAYKREQGW